jgi:hypothetical protein
MTKVFVGRTFAFSRINLLLTRECWYACSVSVFCGLCLAGATVVKLGALPGRLGINFMWVLFFVMLKFYHFVLFTCLMRECDLKKLFCCFLI